MNSVATSNTPLNPSGTKKPPAAPVVVNCARSSAFRPAKPLFRYLPKTAVRDCFGDASRASAFAANSFFMSAARSNVSICVIIERASLSIASNFCCSSAFNERPSFWALSTSAIAPLISSALWPLNSMFFIVLNLEFYFCTNKYWTLLRHRLNQNHPRWVVMFQLVVFLFPNRVSIPMSPFDTRALPRD